MTHANRFLASGRNFEEFKILVERALVGPKDLQWAVCAGLHVFMSKLPQIELLDSAPWEPSLEERAANIRLVEKVIESVSKSLEINNERRKQWVRDQQGKWIRQPSS